MSGERLARPHSGWQWTSWLLPRVRDGLLVIDADSYRVVDATPAARTLFGWDPDAAVGHALNAFVVEGSRAEVQAAL